MMTVPSPTLFQINTRVWLYELGERLGRAATLEDVPDDDLDRWHQQGFDWIWLLGVWQTGEAGRQVSATNPAWRDEYQTLLPDYQTQDICGSPFAIQDYRIHEQFGGSDALTHLRARMQRRGLRLLLDFVPNHTALDHRWVTEHPEYYIHGNDADLGQEPLNYVRLETRLGPQVFAHGRDPFFPGWCDTAQLNYRHPAARAAMLGELSRIASQCDGVRCDMAMLLLPDVMARTWGERSLPSDRAAPVDTSFWPAAIAAIREQHPDFCFFAEVYWDLEWQLQQQEFDYTYDKRLYDRLHQLDAPPVRGHLQADPAFQDKSARFLENHDEPRASAAFPDPYHEAAAVVTYCVPGMRFFQEGQLDGRVVRASIHLRRRRAEIPNPERQRFYDRLLQVLQRDSLRNGQWQLLSCRAAWDNNPTWDRFLAFWWQPSANSSSSPHLVVVNFGPTTGQCDVVWPRPEPQDRIIHLRDQLHEIAYDRQARKLAEDGLYLDLPAWQYHLFEVE